MNEDVVYLVNWIAYNFVKLNYDKLWVFNLVINFEISKEIRISITSREGNFSSSACWQWLLTVFFIPLVAGVKSDFFVWWLCFLSSWSWTHWWWYSSFLFSRPSGHCTALSGNQGLSLTTFCVSEDVIYVSSITVEFISV